ncbi:hypothetical protein NC651_039645 [Populus alba x Populus x berolinensis]|nr:hypothetical protein NC651_039610 [Populus alba x Populus x berolinensis]KAJ6854751.1 hypothetical protein NC651_039645 [Populus alba x Populus x berolinensis]
MDAKVLFQLMKVAKHQQERIVVNASCSSQVLPTVAWTADSSFTNPVQNCHKKFSSGKTSSVTGLISIDLCQVSVLSIESLYARSAKEHDANVEQPVIAELAEEAGEDLQLD